MLEQWLGRGSPSSTSGAIWFSLLKIFPNRRWLRSIGINTENGLLIDSPALARQLAEHIEFIMATENAWQVTTSKPSGKGVLRGQSNGETRTSQPSPSVGKRVSDFIFGLLPASYRWAAVADSRQPTADSRRAAVADRPGLGR